MKKPKKLNKGDKIGIFLPSSPIKDEFRKRGLENIRKMGLIPVEVGNIFENSGYAGKLPEKVVEDIDFFLNDDTFSALLAARGGYGSNFLLNKLDKFKEKEPKIIIGSSDVGYLLWGLMKVMNMVVFHGPMAYSGIADNKYDSENFFKILTGDYEEIRVEGKVLKGGKANSVVTGGCLSNIASLCGSEFFPNVENKILLIEDVNERPFRLDRMLWQLEGNGVFSKINGIIFGEFVDCFINKEEKKMFYRSIMKYFEKCNYPILYDMPFGHSSNAKTLPLGIKININTKKYPGLIIREKGVTL